MSLADTGFGAIFRVKNLKVQLVVKFFISWLTSSNEISQNQIKT